MSGDFKQSKINLRSISYFAPALEGNELETNVNGHVEGYVNDLSFKNISFEELNSSIKGEFSGSLSGLTKVKYMLADFNIKKLEFTSKGIEKFAGLWSEKPIKGIEKFAKGQHFTFSGTGKGTLDKLLINGSILSGIGSLDANLRLEDIVNRSKAIRLKGNIDTKSLDVGKITGNDKIHECSVRTALSASFDKSGLSLDIDSLIVDKMNVLGYDYTDIAAAGKYSDNAFNGKIVSKDPNLNFLFQGIFTLSRITNNAKYVFYANIGYADLNALHLDKRGISKMAMELNADYTRISKGDMIGNLDINNLTLENNKGRHPIGEIHISSHSNDDIHRMKFESSFADGTYTGSAPISEIFDDVRDLTLKKELPAVFKDPSFSKRGNRYDLSFVFKNTRDLLSFLMPGMYIADSTIIKFNMDKKGALSGTVKSPRIAFADKYLKDIDMQIDNNNESLNGKLLSGEMGLSSLLFRNNALMVYANNDYIGVGYSYDNEKEQAEKGEIYFTSELSRTLADSLICKTKVLQSNIYYNNSGWNIHPAEIDMERKKISIRGFNATCNDQALDIDGEWAANEQDTMQINLVRFDISLIDKLIKNDLGISGLATGRALLISSGESGTGILANMTCDSTIISGKRAGTVKMASVWDEDDKKFDIILKNDLSGISTINASASYYPSVKKLQAKAILNHTDIGYISPLFSTLFSEMDGNISGEFSVEGPLDKLKLSSEKASFDDAVIRIGYTNTAYKINGPFHLDNNGFHFDDTGVYDRFKGTGKISGGIMFRNLKNPRMDTEINFTNLECLNTTANDNKSFFGNVFATGNISISGPFNAISLVVNATTADAGTFHIPIGASSQSGNGTLLTFRKEEKEIYVDPYYAMIRRNTASKQTESDTDIKLNIMTTPQTEALIEFDKTNSNILSARGSGMINLEIRPKRDLMNINGEYNISDGYYHFTAIGIAQRDFTISDGSYIKFNGDIMDSDLSINGLYTTKTSIASLISDTTSISTRKTVNCGINITDKLKNPHLSFSIEVKDLDPATKAKVESALNSDDKIQKQLLSLLISNRFLPEEQSGIINNYNVLYSNVAEIMSNQLNNIFQKLDIPLDLGLNYQSDNKGNDLFDVALSTQLFNDRVIVNGTLGNRQYNTSENNQDVVGDLDIEVKLDKSGKLRLNLFSHSADAYTNYLDNSQRNGIGIGYQQEYNNISEFLKNLFSGKDKRKAENGTPSKEKQVLIEIKPEDMKIKNGK
jgi:hypothetical protein